MHVLIGCLYFEYNKTAAAADDGDDDAVMTSLR